MAKVPRTVGILPFIPHRECQLAVSLIGARESVHMARSMLYLTDGEMTTGKTNEECLMINKKQSLLD